MLIHGVHCSLARTHRHGLDAGSVVVVAVGAAAAFPQNRLVAQLLVGFDHSLDDGRVVRQAVGRVGMVQIDDGLATPAGRGALQCVDDDNAVSS